MPINSKHGTLVPELVRGNQMQRLTSIGNPAIFGRWLHHRGYTLKDNIVSQMLRFGQVYIIRRNQEFCEGLHGQNVSTGWKLITDFLWTPIILPCRMLKNSKILRSHSFSRKTSHGSYRAGCLKRLVQSPVLSTIEGKAAGALAPGTYRKYVRTTKARERRWWIIQQNSGQASSTSASLLIFSPSFDSKLHTVSESEDEFGILFPLNRRTLQE